MWSLWNVCSAASRTCWATNSLLYHRFVHGLRHEDEGCLSDAMVSLRLYPDEIRRMVEDTVMSWLFGARGDAIAGRLEISPQG